MQTVSSKARQVAWRDRRTTVNLLAEMARKQQHVAETLTQLRERVELSQEDAARRAHVGYRSYQRWEAGEAMPHPENLKKLARAFGVRLDELLPPDPNDGIESTVASNAARLDRIEHLLEEIRDALLTPSLTPEQLEDLQRLRKPDAESPKKKQGSDEPGEAGNASPG